MLLVREILGDIGEPRFAGRAVERLALDSSEAAKRRLRRVTDVGTDVALDLERGTYLRHGAVLADDGARVIVVQRKPEEAMIVRLSERFGTAELVLLGHAFGNQHVPLEVEGDEIRVPITTSREIAAETVRALGLHGVELCFREVPLGLERPLLAPVHSPE